MIHEIHGNQWTPAFCNHYSISQTLSAAFGSLPLRDTFNTLWWEPWNWHLINGEHVTGRLFITIMTDREGRIDDEGRLKLGHKNKTTCSSHETWYDGSVLWDVMGNERLTYIDVSKEWIKAVLVSGSPQRPLTIWFCPISGWQERWWWWSNGAVFFRLPEDD